MTFIKKHKKSPPLQIKKPEPIAEFQVEDLKSDIQRIDAKKILR